MGRKAKINLTEQTEEANLQNQQNAEVSSDDNQSSQEKTQEPGTDNVAPAEQEVPEYVDKILKMYADYEELYVSNKGGVFTVGTPEHIRGNAVLYKNKYFHK